MKIILTAFNETLKSDIMEYPDNTGDDFWLPLPFDESFITDMKIGDSAIPQTPRGRFRHTGRYYTKNNEAIAIYALVDLWNCDSTNGDSLEQMKSIKKEVITLEKEVNELEEEAQRRNINSLKGSDFGRITGK